MKLELAKIGLADNGQELTEKDVRELIETFPEVQKAPVVLGHRQADHMPAFGYVTELAAAQGKLYGDVELLDPLQEAYDEGYYRSWSVGGRRRPKDGKLYLHHLAFLGAVPPAIKGLEVVSMSEPGGGEMVYFEFAHTQGGKDMELEKENKDLKEKLDQAQKNLEELQNKNKEFSDQEARVKELSDHLGRVQGQLKDQKKDDLRQAASGKVPKEKLDRLMELADKLDNSPVELADKTEKEPLEVLRGIFAALPQPVSEGRLDLGDPPAGDDEGVDMSKLAGIV